ncbi:TPA: hypothetical protein EYN98_14280 [Candidatus Poribacteria bacterium]|nr:hypothetical protein [Candidatus Poribacteria bacterium]HIB87836.1 hypothetical protein [Candidatus Poribacteria bacterium]HIC00520.1 hypothetical protein [Candidatus Poribacteria bacterium]HIN30669.1 hypothetical protein [Candidatus Poribacteria bacterium]HIO09926.1 hypothetical protein [Candidatus Poribacteria bacterium]
MISSCLRTARQRFRGQLCCLSDSGCQGLSKLHSNSWLPKKQSKHRPLSQKGEASNRDLARGRIYVEHVIGKLKVFGILCQRYRDHRRCLSLLL